jgi:hypothetical protein
MNRLEAWLLHCSTILLTATGLIYAGMHYLLKPVDPFSVVNHPWEPYMIDLHILAAPVLIIGIGIVLHSHMLWKLGTGGRTARRSGITLLSLFAVMTLSGYLLQIVTGSGRIFFVVLHLVAGTVWAAGYLVHHLASLRVRRVNGNERYGI